MIKRIFLFLAVNFLVLVTISIVINILGIEPYLTRSGLNYVALFQFCLVYGFVGSFVSLALSRVMAKWMMGVRVIDPANPGEYAWLCNMVGNIAQAAKLPVVPEIGVYNSSEVNAFATGPTKSRALVAFSSGLLQRMTKEQIQGVTAHELSHVNNGDMVTMALVQGVMNAFVLFLSRVIGFIAGRAVEERQEYLVRFIVQIVLDILLSILASIVVFWFSRQREFRADSGAAKLVGAQNMISALEELGKLSRLAQVGEEHASLNTLKISGKSSGWMHLFASHPPIEARIEALKLLA